MSVGERWCARWVRAVRRERHDQSERRGGERHVDARPRRRVAVDHLVLQRVVPRAEHAERRRARRTSGRRSCTTQHAGEAGPRSPTATATVGHSTRCREHSLVVPTNAAHGCWYSRTSVVSTLRLMDPRTAHAACVARAPRRGDPPHRSQQGRVRRAGGRRPHDAVAAAVADRRPPAPRRHAARPGRRPRPVARLARRAVQRRAGRGRAAPRTRRSRRPGRRRPTSSCSGWLERGRRLQDPLRPVDAARPAEDGRRDPVRALPRRRARRRADHRDDGGPAVVGPPSRHRDGVLLVDAGAGVVRPGRGNVEPARRRAPGASSSTR